MTKPIRTLGVVGGNLLAAMLCIEAKKRGIRTILLEPELTNLATEVADDHMVSTIQKSAIERLALRTDAVIFCNSDIPVLDKKFIDSHTFYPSNEGIELVANRVQQLVTAALGEVPAPTFNHYQNKIAFLKGLEEAIMPFNVYQIYQDGYEMTTIEGLNDMESFLVEFDHSAVEWMIEEVNVYERQLSVTTLVKGGKVYFYPIQEEHTAEETVQYVEMPALLPKTNEQKIKRFVKKIVKEFEGEGLYTFKFGLTKNKRMELVNINSGITVGDVATSHYTDLSVYEQFLNLIEGKPVKDGELLRASMLTIAREEDTQYRPTFPYHEYNFDKHQKRPVVMYIKAKDVE